MTRSHLKNGSLGCVRRRSRRTHPKTLVFEIASNKERINSPQKIARVVKLTRSGKALIVTLLFRLLFGGYLLGMDQYRFNDVESALTVLMIYGLIGLLATLFILGTRYGLLGLIGLDAIFIVLQSVFTILTLSQIIDPGLHDPLVNWWATLLMCLFSVLTTIFSLRANRETNLSRGTFENLRLTLETKYYQPGK